MTAGLRRFVVPEPAQPPADGPARCELCAEHLGGEHGHLVDLGDRTIACACRACYLLFTVDGAGGGSYRAVPQRYRYAPRLPITDAVWDRLGIPVGMAFFFYNSTLDQLAGLYPSPAGATESLLAFDAWVEVVEAAPALARLAPDVEALLVNRLASGGRPGGGGGLGGGRPGGGGRLVDGEPVRFEGFAVPIDACYRLVGLVRLHWRGFDGGEQAWQAIDEFLAELRERSEQVSGDGHG